MIVIDNFLAEDRFKSIQEWLLGDEIPWIYDKVGECYTSASYFKLNTTTDQRFPIDRLTFFLHELDIRRFINVELKDTLRRNSIFNKKFPPQKNSDHEVAFLYINTTNAYVKSPKSPKVRGIENRIIVCEKDELYTSVTGKDHKRSVVLQVNYTPINPIQSRDYSRRAQYYER